ncbi:uncharacterized protein LOC134525444 [Chroicocephalus ridibundus]|uniref:uncharacterized protein LOC134525444 n=1 Tax=Chroicocephalus ridibundus TaxID=1192867 RepID=UPI002FDCE59B
MNPSPRILPLVSIRPGQRCVGTLANPYPLSSPGFHGHWVSRSRRNRRSQDIGSVTPDYLPVRTPAFVSLDPGLLSYPVSKLKENLVVPKATQKKRTEQIRQRQINPLLNKRSETIDEQNSTYAFSNPFHLLLPYGKALCSSQRLSISYKRDIQTKVQSGSGKTPATSFTASSISAEVNQTKVQNAAFSWNPKRIRMDSSSSSALTATSHLARVACNAIHSKKPSDITRLKLVITLPPAFLPFKRAASHQHQKHSN